jgi:Flp pilus assembly protein TadD
MRLKYYNTIRQVGQDNRFYLKIERWKILVAVFIFIAVFSLFSGCASIPIPKVEKVPIDRFQAYNMPDGTKIHPASINDVIPDVDILAINHEITSMLDDIIIKIRNPKKRMEALKEILIQKVQYDTVDDSYGVKTAQETFDTGSGNCLSFSNLFVAMARYTGFKTKYQEIPTLPNWTREGEVLFFTRHIGASIDVYQPNKNVIQLELSDENLYMIVDSPFFSYIFAPSELDPYAPDVNLYSIHPIPDYRAFAQYYNNIGSQFVAEGNNAKAFQYFVKALIIDPQLSFAWSNLGVLYRRNGQFEAAEAAYFQGLAVTHGSRDSSMMIIMNNMANLYDDIGNTEKAAFYKDQVASFREKNPYYQYTAAKTAYYDALYETSIKHFKKAIRLKDDEHLFYYGLALAYLKMGDTKNAEKNIDKAIRYSRNEKKKAYYEQIRDKLDNVVIN